MPARSYYEDMEHTPRALIIGGGVGGPAAALFLRRAGIASRIFEAYPEPTTTGGGFQIAPNGMRVLNALGVADRVRAAGVTSGSFVFRNQQGKIISQIDLSGSGYGVTLMRAAFQRVLLDEIGRQGVPIEYGRRLCGIESEGDVVTARFEDGSVERGDMLLAFDGVRFSRPCTDLAGLCVSEVHRISRNRRFRRSRKCGASRSTGRSSPQF